jgi:hypothetical protein
MSRGRPAPRDQTSGLQWLLLIVAVVVVVRWQWLGGLGLFFAYAGVCWWWPIATCGKCGGSGKCFAPIGRSHRTCPRCDGEGRHVRLGARLLRSGDV